jgi:flagellar hook-length control protein FliK
MRPRPPGPLEQPHRPADSRSRENTRESDPRRDDPPRRSDPPRGADRPEGEPTRRSDPPRGSFEGVADAPPGREDPPGLTKAEADGLKAGEAEVQAEADTNLDAEASFDPAVQTPAGLTAPLGCVPNPDVQPSPAASPAHSVATSALPAGQRTTTSDSVTTIPQADQADQAETQPGAPKVGVPKPELQAAGDVEANVHESETHDEQEHEDAVQDQNAQSTAEPAPREAAQIVTAAAEATATVPLSATLTNDQPQPGTDNDAPAPVGHAAATVAKTVSAHREHIVTRERAELPGPNGRTETPQARPAETSASEAGAGAKAAVKPDQILPAAPEATLTTLPSAPSAAPAVQQAAQVTQTPQAPHAQQAPTHVIAEVPLSAVPIEIGLKSLAGINHFEIRLDPVELGRIEVRLEIDKEGGVKAHLSVDRVETMALLQRDAKTLESAFDQAGLKLSGGSVDVSLRDQTPQGQGRQDQAGDQRHQGSRHPNRDMRRDDANPVPIEPPRRIRRGIAGIDVRI